MILALNCVATDCANNFAGQCIYNVCYLRINAEGMCDCYEPPKEADDDTST